jgi:hypothetical protein
MAEKEEQVGDAAATKQAADREEEGDKEARF